MSYGTPPPQPGQPAPYGYGPPPNHPRATTVLVLGILALAFCGILGIPAWVIGNTALREIDVVLLRELHGVDGAVAAPAGIDPPAHRALLPEQTLLLGGLGGALGVDRDRIPVRDGRVVLHRRHRLFGRFAVIALGDVGLLAGHEAHDVVDLADALGPPAGGHPHALGHRVDAPRVDRMDHRVVGAVELLVVVIGPRVYPAQTDDIIRHVDQVISR